MSLLIPWRSVERFKTEKPVKLKLMLLERMGAEASKRACEYGVSRR